MSDRNMALDWLKLALAVAVVGIHTLPFIDELPLLAYVLAHGIFRVAVPIFFMATGFYFSRMMEGPVQIKAWFGRLLLLYIIWMVVYSVNYVPRNLEPGNFLRFLLILFTGYWHLWYLISACLGGAMLYRMRSCSDKMLGSIATLLFFGGVGVQYMVAWLDMENGNAPAAFDHQILCRNFLFLAFPFVTAGYLLRRGAWVDRVKVSTLSALFAGGIFLICIESLENYRHYGMRQPFETLFSLPLAVVCLFLLAHKVSVVHGPKFIGTLSIAIYLAHPMVILLVSRIGVKPGTMQFLCTLFVTVAISPALLRIARSHPALLYGNRSVAPGGGQLFWRS
jgi:surface polysaccharide O-acyltransferase-like enzyme